MVAAVLMPNPKVAFITSAGAPAVGYKVYTYDAGTLAPRPTYLDAAGGASNTNPIILDARGEAVIYWDGAYKVILKDAADVTIWTADNVSNTFAPLASPTFTGVVTVQAGLVGAPSITTLGDTNTGVYFPAADTVAVTVGGADSARFTSAGIGIGMTPSARLSVQGTGAGQVFVFNTFTGSTAMMYSGAGNLTVSTGESATNSMLFLRKDSTSSRSLSAAGTLNASGADYAEYETKAPACGNIAKGQIIGFDASGHITDKWADVASRFGIKSTDPSYVGGDAWGSEEALGMAKPIAPDRADGETDAVFAQRHSKHTAKFLAFADKLEAARLTVDRIAYAGKCPCNVLGATVGDYILPVQDGAGIAGMPIAAPTFDQYRAAVGRVVSLLPDGRCTVALMVH